MLWDKVYLRFSSPPQITFGAIDFLLSNDRALKRAKGTPEEHFQDNVQIIPVPSAFRIAHLKSTVSLELSEITHSEQSPYMIACTGYHKELNQEEDNLMHFFLCRRTFYQPVG